MTCEKCNGEIEEGGKACRWCGADIPENIKKNNKNKNKNKNNNKNKKAIIIIAISVACILVAATIVIFTMPTNPPNKSQGLAGTTARVTGTVKDSSTNITGSDMIPTDAPTGVSDSEEDLSSSTEQLLYIKGKNHSIYYSSLDQLKPRMIINDFKDRFGKEPNGFFMSENEKRIMFQLQPDMLSMFINI